MMLSLPAVLLLLSVSLPLLLALPVLRQYLPQQRVLNPLTLSLLPAFILVLFFDAVSIELPWLFFGSALAMDLNNRWLMFMLVIIWLLFNFQKNPQTHQPSSRETFILLCLAMSLATVLSVDLLSFFIYSSIMGYSFYAVIFHNDERHIKASGTLYIVSLVLADIALFDALLIAAHADPVLEFKNVQVSMADVTSNRFYLFMVLSGFFLRAAIWPLHFWLTRRFSADSTGLAYLIPVLPVAIALLGLIRWLPIEQSYDEPLGWLLSSVGLCAITYALIRLLSSGVSQQTSAWLTLIYSGSFIILLGWFLSTTYVLSDYEIPVYAYIAIGSLVIAALHFVQSQRQHKTEVATDKISILLQRFEQGLITFWHRRKQHGDDLIEHIELTWRLWRRLLLNRFQILLYARHRRSGKNEWHKPILLLVLLGLVIAWLR